MSGLPSSSAAPLPVPDGVAAGRDVPAGWLGRARRRGRVGGSSRFAFVSMAFSVVSTLTVAALLVGFALLGQQQASVMKDFWFDKVEVSLFLCSPVASPSCSGPVSATERQALADRLAGDGRVAEVFYESSVEALARFSQLYEGSPVVDSVTADALPESFRVKLVDPDAAAVFADSYRGVAGVDEVVNQREALEGFFSVLSAVQRGALVLALTIAATALLLVANTVKLALSSRRREVEIRTLVGASSWQVNRVFLAQVLPLALVSAVLAASLLAVFKAMVVDGVFTVQFPFTSFVSWPQVAVTMAVVSVLTLVLPLVAAWLTLSRFHTRARHS